MGKQSEMLVQLHQLLADHEWHDVEPIVTQLGLLVLPSRAIELLEEQRARVSKTTERARPLTRDESIVMGRRIAPLDAIRVRVHGGHIEQRYVERAGRQVRQIRSVRRKTYSASDVARLTGRSPSTLSDWISSPVCQQWFAKRLPEGVPMVVRQGARSFVIPEAAVSAWIEYSSKQPVLSRTSLMALVDAVEAALMPTTRDEAERLSMLIRDELLKRDHAVRRRSEGGAKRSRSEELATHIEEGRAHPERRRPRPPRPATKSTEGYEPEQ